MADTTRDASAARLVLEDGAVFRGRGFGAGKPGQSPSSRTGEVVFNTAMTGYQEALTDPSYAGQILVMTATQIGNYGICEEDLESARPQVAGFVVRELSRIDSNHRSHGSLCRWLAEGGVIGIEGIDTRALVCRLRTAGAMRGVISRDADLTDEALVAMTRESPPMSGRNLAAEVSTTAPFAWSEGRGTWSGRFGPRKPGATAAAPLRVMVLDCGAKRTIHRHLVDRGCVVEVHPHDRSAGEIRAAGVDGILVSNGPGDPSAVERTIATLRALIAEDDPIPTFGICLGHQLLARAIGATTFKLKFGHRGANQPVRNTLTGRVEITSQNHGFCVDPESLESAGCEMTHLHLNDGTLAGFRHRTKPVFSVQHHPEASPGPHDSAYLFDCFIELMRTRRSLDRAVTERALDAAAT